jgi:hypothetical protein
MVAVTNCNFCDQPIGPGRPRSREHAAPNWCRNLLPDLGPAVHVHAVVTPGGRQDTEMGERDVFTTVCGDVCHSATPRQTLAATWAVKTAMVWVGKD